MLYLSVIKYMHYMAICFGYTFASSDSAERAAIHTHSRVFSIQLFPLRYRNIDATKMLRDSYSIIILHLIATTKITFQRIQLLILQPQ